MAVEDQPLFRGVSHQFAAIVAAVAGVVLVLLAGGGRATVAAAIYAVSLTAMLGVSAAYHRVWWGPRAQLRWKRADHAMIFVFIAGTYTPICLLAMGGPAGSRLLLLVWLGAGLGAAQALLWTHAPRALPVVLYIALGWLMVAYLPEVRAALAPAAVLLLLAGGLLYTGGAIVYALRRPNPSPRLFGYHEIFHACVVVACVCHFVVVAAVVRGHLLA